MAKKICIVLGNGFTIDFLNHLKLDSEIDVVNLFRYGANVPWPSDNMPGFLSFKYCPNLWNLGARPHMDKNEAMALIENIITCVNVYSLKPPTKMTEQAQSSPNDIYLSAYSELLLYLKYLFVFYNNKIADIPDEIVSWSWYKFLESINRDDNYEEIVIISYNYDIFLERILQKAGIDFEISLIGDKVPKSKIKILKPHGSISFVHDNELSIDSFQINYKKDFSDCSVTNFNTKYFDLNKHYLVTPLIPPAGESGRLNHTWAGQIRTEVKSRIANLTKNDELIICGNSYWHVDRAELDDILISCNPTINIMMINPFPSKTLDAVLTSIFVNYVSFLNASVLEGRINA
ncbi:SIR2 family protein [Desulfoluna spongiiphila]|uniref:hypothetical protein n=1 Tax=Desulfoluna spongiiphila TaxID=419481 RepID=UPI001250D667|nr:hypothetical protein [Desulfoluna spongiiphila]VVS90990.1 hypothetical protein DBB_5580 [Desulfoluna spongiiphila]